MGYRSIAMIALAFAARNAGGQTVASRATLDSMSTFFVGHWSCDGKFANGGPISADVTFEAALDGRWVVYTHTDRPPNRFKMHALWGFDGAVKALVSAAADNGGGLRMFRAPDWSNGTVTFERVPADTTTRPERFIYRRESDSTFRMTYEVKRGPSPWIMGDYIVCARR